MSDSPAPAPAPVRAPLPRPTRPCRCGCGEQTQGTWVPGHDAKAKGAILAVARGLAPHSSLAPLGDLSDLVARWGLGHVSDDGEVTLVAPPTKNPTKLSPVAKALNAIRRLRDEASEAGDHEAEHILDDAAAFLANPGGMVVMGAPES